MQRYALLAVMSACFATIALDNSKLVAALPTLARLSTESPALQHWVVEAGLLVYASALLLGGALSERFGPRRVLLLGLLGFAAASVWGALASSLLQLIAARAVTGAATACVTPATMAAIKHRFDDAERPRAIAIWTASFAVGAALGPVIAGLLVGPGGMRWVLLANLLPIALVLYGSFRLVPSDLPRREVPLDVPGTLLCLGAAGSLVFALLSGPTQGWLAPPVLFAFAAAVGLLAGCVVWFRYARHPLLDATLFGRPRFSRALLVILFGYFAFSGSSFVTQQYLQLGRGKSPLESGLTMLPLSIAMLGGTLLAPWLMKRTSDVRALYFSLGLALLGALGMVASCSAGSDLWLCLAMMPFAAGAGSTFANATELTLGSVSVERAASAGGLSEATFELGGVLGIALASTVLGVGAASVGSHAPRAYAISAVAMGLALVIHSARVLRSVKPTPTRTAVSE